MNILIPMAGKGQRFKDAGFKDDKPLIDVNGSPMIVKAINSLGFTGNYHFIIRKGKNTDKIYDLLSQNYKGVVRTISKVTEGPACTCNLMRNFINTNEELVIANCDQIMWWDGEAVLNACRYVNYDGVLITYTSDSTKNSYVKLDENGLATTVREKEVISNISLNGIHYWKKGKYFIESYDKMVQENDRAPNGEFYVGPTFHHMIELGYRVGIHHIPNFQHHAVGTPDDLREYIKNEKIQTGRHEERLDNRGF